MNRKITTFVLIVMFASPIFAQQSNMDYTPLQPFVPSGILYENNPSHIFHNPSHLNHPMHFLGDDDSLCTASIFKDLYRFFYYANFDTATQPLPVMPTVLNQTISNTSVTPEVKLGLMHFNFEAISAEASTYNLLSFDTLNSIVSLDTGWVRIQDTVFVMDTINMVVIDTITRDTLVYHDADSIASIAFDTHTLFAASAYNPWIELESLTDNVTFSLDFVNFFSNIPINQNGPYRISLDGLNFINIYPNNPPISFPGHTFSEGLNEIYIRQGVPNENEVRVRTNFFVNLKVHVPNYQMDDFSQVECPDLDYSAGIGSGVVTFKINDLSGGSLKKPVIIVENFEMERNVDNINSQGAGNISSATRTYGVVGWNSFSSGSVPVLTGLDNPLSRGKTLIDSLLSSGYDIVFVDFKTSRAKVRQNANFLMKIIQHVNVELRNNNSDEEIAILGMGTGGVVARVALREMELQSCCHNTRMFTSFDSPHRGLNIPLGLQAFLESTSFDFYNVPTFGLLRFYNQVIKSPLLEELMIYNYDSTLLNIRHSFQSYLDSIGMPQGSRNFAIINGSDVGEIQKDNSNNLFMNPDSSYFTMMLENLVPTAINFTQGYNQLFGNLSQGFILAYASPKVLGHNNSKDQQIILERGPDFAINNQKRRNYMNSWWTGMVLYTITVLAYVAAIFGFIPIAPLIEAAKIITIALIQGVWNGQLNDRLVDNQNLNPHPDYAVYNPYSTLSYDRSPGGRNDLSLRLSRISNGILGNDVNVLHNHSLVPSISALNMDTTAINMNIRVDRTVYIAKGSISFEEYHAPTEEGGGRDNESHTLLTVNDGYIEGNIEWFVERLNQTRSPIVANPQTILTVQNETMNYGIPFDKTIAPEKYLHNMEILENGKLGVNVLNHIGFPFQNFNFPANRSNFLVFTQAPECGGTYCKVDSLGLFQIGDYVSHDPNSSTTGTAVFLENSTLELLPGSKLVIDDNSSLIIEEGATLIYHPGAVIELNGGDAILEIKGKVEVKDNAVFTFTSQNPNNYGHIIFNQRQWDAGGEIPISEYWEIGDNAQFVLEGPIQHGNVLMECKRNFRTSSGSSPRFSLIKIRNGAIKIHESRNANLTADSLFFEYVVVDKADVNQNKHQGVQ
ncbi:MAG: hypothetical protein JJU02_06880, partial [Cryomorphaceae bacterium]|nr:hypothetical protein [Cryomorphaceae bacterium]